METIRQLLLICVGIWVINLVLSAVFWIRYRTKLHRALFFVWGSSILAGFVQSFPVTESLAMALVMVPSFLVALSLSSLLRRVAGVEIQNQRYWLTLAAGTASALVAHFMGAAFWTTALLVSLGAALPLIETPLRLLFSREARLAMPAKAAAVSCLAYGMHMLDYPFLRDKPQFAVMGFSLAVFVIFAVSTTAPAAVLDRVAGERARIEQLNRIQREFFANVTHELRTPLTMILAPVETLLHGEVGMLTASQKGYVDTIWRNGTRLLKLINDLLDLAKIDEGFLRIRPERAALAAVAEDLVNYAGPLAARKGLKLEVEVKSSPEDVFIDAERMERVLVNLIANALKFTERGGVKIIVDAAGDEALITVEDTGVGIPVDQLERIFERFTQGDASGTRKYGGTGIGLAFAREIVRLHGGRITVTSTVGVGSRFVVRLRRGDGHFSESVLERRSSASVTDAGGQRADDGEPREWALRIQRNNEYRFGELVDVTERRRVPRGMDETAATRVLIVEDNREVLELIHLTLQTEHAVMVAQDGKQGLELATRMRPDLIVTDYMMPEMDGLDLLKALRSHPEMADVPVIMLTAKNTVEDRLSARDAGADIYLGKPFSPRELAAAARALLEKRGRQVGRVMRAQIDSLEAISAGLAHEIHNPLNFLKNAHHMIVENLAKIGPLLEVDRVLSPAEREIVAKARGKIDRIVGSADRGVNRIERVVDVVRRYAREGYPRDLQPMLFDEAVADIVSLLAPRGEGECEVTLELAAQRGRVLCLPDEMHQAIRCLVQNGIDAGGSKGHVWVRSRRERGSIVMDVVDDGPGVPPELRTKIFSPFFTTKATGMGAGLAIVTRVAQQTGGRVELASAPGERTTFRITLPEAQVEPQAPSARVPAERVRAQA